MNQKDGRFVGSFVGVNRRVSLFIGSYLSREGHSSSRLPRGGVECLGQYF